MMSTRFLATVVATVLCTVFGSVPLVSGQSSDVSIMQTLYQLHQMQNAYYLQYQQTYNGAQSSSVVSQLNTIQQDEAVAIQRLGQPLSQMNAGINTCYNFTGLMNITTTPTTYLLYAAQFSNMTTNVYGTAITNITNKSYMPLLLALFENEAQHSSYLYTQVNNMPFTARLGGGNSTSTPFLPLSSASNTLRTYAVNCNQTAAVAAAISMQQSANSGASSGSTTTPISAGNAAASVNPANNANPPGMIIRTAFDTYAYE